MYYWFGNASADILQNTIIKAWLFGGMKNQRIIWASLNIRDATQDWKLTNVSCGKISSGKLLSVNFEEVLCLYAS